MQSTLERLKERRQEKGDEGGFTLIELLIVIVILAILAAIIVFAVQNLTASSAKASCESDVSTVDHAVQAYEAQVGKAPVAITDLMATPNGLDGTPVGPWLHSLPTNGTHYAITLTKDNSTPPAAVTDPASTATPKAAVGNGGIIVNYTDSSGAHQTAVYTGGTDTTPEVTAATACGGVH